MKDSQLHAHVVVKTSNLVTSSLCRGSQKYLLKSVGHVQHDYLRSFNQWYHSFVALLLPSPSSFLKLPREFTQPRRRRQQERHKFAYLTMKNNRFARFARAFFIFGHSADVLVLSTTWNDLFCSCEDDVSTRWQMFNFFFLSLKRWFQFNFWIVRTHFATVMTMNNSEMTAETRSYIFRLRSRCRRRRVCVNSLMFQVVSRRSLTGFGNCDDQVNLAYYCFKTPSLTNLENSQFVEGNFLFATHFWGIN